MYCLIFPCSSFALHGNVQTSFNSGTSQNIKINENSKEVHSNGVSYFINRNIVYEKDSKSGTISNLEGQYNNRRTPQVESIGLFHGELIAKQKNGSLWIWKRNERRWLFLEGEIESVDVIKNRLIIQKNGKEFVYDDSYFCHDQLRLRKDEIKFKSRFITSDQALIKNDLEILKKVNKDKFIKSNERDCDCDLESRDESFCKKALTISKDFNTQNYVTLDRKMCFIDGGGVYCKYKQTEKIVYLKSRRSDSLSLHYLNNTLYSLHKDTYLYKWSESKGDWRRVDSGVRKVDVINGKIEITYVDGSKYELGKRKKRFTFSLFK